MAEELTEKKFDEFVKKGIVLVDFYANWCMPCVMMGPIVDNFSKKFKGKMKVGKVNIDENSGLVKRFDVMSIPNFIIFKDGKIAERFMGSVSEEEFEKRLKRYL